MKLLKPGESDELPARFMVETVHQAYELTMFPDGQLAYVPIGKPRVERQRFFELKED